jgi:selenide,water dikinase
LDVARGGVETEGGAHNRRFVSGALTVDPTVSPEMVTLAHDPQTSGGLLAAVPPGDIERLEADLGRAGVRSWRVGSVEAGEGVALV